MPGKTNLLRRGAGGGATDVKSQRADQTCRAERRTPALSFRYDAENRSHNANGGAQSSRSIFSHMLQSVKPGRSGGFGSAPRLALLEVPDAHLEGMAPESLKRLSRPSVSGTSAPAPPSVRANAGEPSGPAGAAPAPASEPAMAAPLRDLPSTDAALESLVAISLQEQDAALVQSHVSETMHAAARALVGLSQGVSPPAPGEGGRGSGASGPAASCEAQIAGAVFGPRGAEEVSGSEGDSEHESAAEEASDSECESAAEEASFLGSGTSLADELDSARSDPAAEKRPALFSDLVARRSEARKAGDAASRPHRPRWAAASPPRVRQLDGAQAKLLSLELEVIDLTRALQAALLDQQSREAGLLGLQEQSRLAEGRAATCAEQALAAEQRCAAALRAQERAEAKAGEREARAGERETRVGERETRVGEREQVVALREAEVAAAEAALRSQERAAEGAAERGRSLERREAEARSRAEAAQGRARAVEEALAAAQLRARALEAELREAQERAGAAEERAGRVEERGLDLEQAWARVVQGADEARGPDSALARDGPSPLPRSPELALPALRLPQSALLRSSPAAISEASEGGRAPDQSSLDPAGRSPRSGRLPASDRLSAAPSLAAPSSAAPSSAAPPPLSPSPAPQSPWELLKPGAALAASRGKPPGLAWAPEQPEAEPCIQAHWPGVRAGRPPKPPAAAARRPRYGDDPAFREIKRAYEAVVAAQLQGGGSERASWTPKASQSPASQAATVEPAMEGLMELLREGGLAAAFAKTGPCQYRLGVTRISVRLAHGQLVVCSGAGHTPLLAWLAGQPLSRPV